MKQLRPNKLLIVSGLWLLVVMSARTQPARPAAGTGSVLRLHGTAALRQPVRLEPYLTVYGSRSEGVKPQLRVWALPFCPLAEAGFTDDSPEILFWFRLRLANTHPTDTLRGVVYAGHPIGLHAVNPTDRLQQGLQPWPFHWTRPGPDRYPVVIAVLPGTTAVFYVETTNIMSFDGFRPRLLSPDQYHRLHDQQLLDQRFPLAFSALVFGTCLFLSIVGLVMLLVQRDWIYGLWSAYLSCNSLYVYVLADLEFNLNTLPYSMQVLAGPIGHLGELFYFLFLDALLDLQKTDLLLHRVFQGTSWILFISLFISTLSFGTQTLPFLTANNLFLFLTLLVAIFGVLRMAWRPIPGKQMVQIGVSVFTVFVLATVAVVVAGRSQNNPFGQTPHTIYGLGVLFELLFLSIALSQRTLATQQAYNRQKAELQQQLNETEIDRLRSQRDADKRVSDLQLKLSEAKTATLRSQMNPHFIFNALNSIQSFTNKNRADLASDYLAKFARLLRKVLENSRSERIQLATELDTIELYLQMEVMRFQHKVRYRIRVDQQIDTEAIDIPPLLLQPFVENAIWHGLMHKPEGGMIDIEVEEFADRLLHITITDDGVGRAKAAEYKSRSSVTHKSFGTEVTAERISLINQLYQTHIRASTVDLVSPTGEALGTKVIVEIQV
jgi:two-component sensor histidine kinase